DDVGVAGEERIVGDRLGRKHVERRARHLARVQRVLQRGVVDQPAAGHVEDAYALAHLRERARVEQSFGIGRLGQVDGDEVRVRDMCACGMLRASASSSAIVCSAAVTTLDCGALATTMPRLVAASTSTLSTPTPARPITRSLPARPISSAFMAVAERMRMPW